MQHDLPGGRHDEADSSETGGAGTTENPSSEQARQIRELEQEHHKSESPLSMSSNPTAGEVQAHNQRIAGFMSEADARRFLQREARHGWER